MSVTIQPATEIEMPKVRAFVEKIGSSILSEGQSAIQYLTVKDQDAELAAILGIIAEDDTMILRHLIADPKRCDLGMLLEILENAVAFCASNKAKRIVFLTPAPAELFEPIGFKVISWTVLDEGVRSCFPLEDDLPPSAKLVIRELV